MIFVDTHFGIDFWMCFGMDFASFWHQCSCFGVFFFYMIRWLIFSNLREDFATQNGAHESGRGFWGLRPPLQNHVSPPPSFQECFFIDSALFLNHFGDDFEYFSAKSSVVFCNTNDKCLYTNIWIYKYISIWIIYIYIYIYI